MEQAGRITGHEATAMTNSSELLDTQNVHFTEDAAVVETKNQAKAEVTTPPKANKKDTQALRNMAMQAYKNVEPDLAKKKGKKHKKGIQNGLKLGDKSKKPAQAAQHYAESLKLIKQVNPNALKGIANTAREKRLLNQIKLDVPEPKGKAPNKKLSRGIHRTPASYLYLRGQQTTTAARVSTTIETTPEQNNKINAVVKKAAPSIDGPVRRGKKEELLMAMRSRRDRAYAYN